MVPMSLQAFFSNMGECINAGSLEIKNNMHGPHMNAKRFIGHQ